MTYFMLVLYYVPNESVVCVFIWSSDIARYQHFKMLSHDSCHSPWELFLSTGWQCTRHICRVVQKSQLHTACPPQP